MGFSYKSIIPDQLLEVLLDLMDKNDEYCWTVGDLIVAHPGDRGDVCKAFGSVLGVRAKDLRVVAQVSEAYSKEYRIEHSILSWGHFFRAMGKNQEESIKWMENGIDDLGRPSSVDAFLASGFGKDESKEHPAVIMEKSSRQKFKDTVSDLKKIITSGKVNLDKNMEEKIVNMLQSILVFIGEGNERKD